MNPTQYRAGIIGNFLRKGDSCNRTLAIYLLLFIYMYTVHMYCTRLTPKPTMIYSSGWQRICGKHYQEKTCKKKIFYFKLMLGMKF